MKKWIRKLLPLIIGGGIGLLSVWVERARWLGDNPSFGFIWLLFISITGSVAGVIALVHARRLLKRNPTFEAYPVEHLIPEKLQSFHEELQTFGFVLSGEIRSSEEFIWIYFNEDHSIVAHLNPKGIAGFSSYLPDGLSISTFYPKGVSLDVEKGITRIVKSSLASAFDFHLHHIEQFTAEHGEPISFSNLTNLLDWEKQHNYNEMVRNMNLDWGWRFLLFGLTMLLGALLAFITLIKPDWLPLQIQIGLFVILAILSFIVSKRFNPITKATETVESRKKRKAEDLETAAVAQEEIYPF